jgi:hypothetical protein
MMNTQFLRRARAGAGDYIAKPGQNYGLGRNIGIFNSIPCIDRTPAGRHAIGIAA